MPDLPIPVGHWLVKDFTLACAPPSIAFWCETDNTCHLWSHYGLTKPHMKPWRHKKRGLVVTHDRLTVWSWTGIVEQVEPGDTTTHSFIMPIIEYSQPHYWQLRGERLGRPIQSWSQFFTITCDTPPVTYLSCYPSAPACGTYSTGATWAIAWNAPASVWNNTGTLTPSYWHNNAPYGIYRGAIHFDTTGIAVDKTIVSASIYLYMRRLNFANFARYGTPVADNVSVLRPTSCAIPVQQGCHITNKGAGEQVAAWAYDVGDTAWDWKSADLDVDSRNYINKGGITTFALRGWKERINSDPGFKQFRIECKTPILDPFRPVLYIGYV